MLTFRQRPTSSLVPGTPVDTNDITGGLKNRVDTNDITGGLKNRVDTNDIAGGLKNQAT